MSSPRRSRPFRVATLILPLIDACAIMAAFLCTGGLVLWSDSESWRWVCTHLWIYLVLLVFWSWVAIDRGLWEVGWGEDLGTYLLALLRATIGAMTLYVFTMVLVADYVPHRRFLAAFAIGVLVAVPAFRFIVWTGLAILHRHGYRLRTTLIVGSNARSAHLAAVIRSERRHGYRIEGFLEDDGERAALLKAHGVPHLGGFDALEMILRESSIYEVHIALPVRSCSDWIERMASICKEAGVPVHVVADLFSTRIARRNLMYIGDLPLLSLSTIPEAQGELAIKRVFDLVVSSILLIVLLPLFLAVAVAIKFDSPGPVFFVQDRAGRNGRLFRMMKFRSMIADADRLRESLMEQNVANGPAFKMRDDPRITRVGKLLRKLSIDEFPQLINVWRGDMSLVGPRPPLIRDAAQYTWDQRRRLSIRPGMTGLWQVSGRSEVAFEQWLDMDLSYIDNWSLFQDLVILLKTLPAVIRGKGAM